MIFLSAVMISDQPSVKLTPSLHEHYLCIAENIALHGRPLGLGDNAMEESTGKGPRMDRILSKETF